MDTLREVMNFFNLKGRSRSIIGVDIGRSTIKVACLRMAKEISLSFYSIVKLSSPKEQGPNQIQEAIQKVLKDNKVATKDAVLIFSDESIVIRRSQLPYMASDEIPEALKWQAKEMVHFDVDNASIDFELLGSLQKEDGSKFLDCIFAVAPRDIIDKNVLALKAAGLNVVSVGIEPLGIANIVKILEVGEHAKRSVLTVDIGHTTTQVSIFKDGAIEFTRSIPVGSNDISSAMTGTLTSGNGKIELSYDEAESLKIRFGIPYDEAPIEKGISSIQILSMMRPALERLSKEIRRSVDYYVQEYNGQEIQGIYLVGGGSLLKGLDKFLSDDLKIPAKRMEIPRSIDVSKTNLTPEDAEFIIPVLGAVLGSRSRFSLLPHEYRVEKIEFIEKISLRTTAIVVAFVLLGSFFFLRFRVNDYNYRLKNMRFQRAVLSQVKDLQDRVAERALLLAQAQMQEIPTEDVMREMSNIIPPNVVLNHLDLNQVGKTFNIRGVVYEPRGSAEDVLTRFMEALEKSKHFKDAQLVSVQSEAAAREEFSSFDINCSLE